MRRACKHVSLGVPLGGSTIALLTSLKRQWTYRRLLAQTHSWTLRCYTMTKAAITAAIVARTGLTARKSKKALEATLNTIKQGLKDDLIIDMGRLGKLKSTKLTRGRRISRGLRNVTPSIFPYSRHAETVTLKSKLDLSKTPLATIVHPVPAEPAPVVFIKRACAVAYPKWRKRNTRG